VIDNLGLASIQHLKKLYELQWLRMWSFS